jgi:hypothetical protein
MAYRINPNIYKIVLDDVRKALANNNLFTSELDMLLRDCELANIANRLPSNQSSNSELIFTFDSSSSSSEEEDEESENEILPSSHSTVWCVDSEDESSENESEQ